MIKLAAFDLDGTLVNSLNDLASASNLALQEFGYSAHDTNEYRHFVGNGVDRLIQSIVPEEARSDLRVRSKVKEAFNRHYNENYCVETVPYDGIRELLNDLAGRHFKLAVLSNKPDNFVHKIIETLFPDIEFDVIGGASDNLPKKPNPALLLRCLDELHLDASECIYCGDSDTDVLFAHSAGIKVIGAAWGFRGFDELEQAGADYIINYPSELSALLDILN